MAVSVEWKSETYAVLRMERADTIKVGNMPGFWRFVDGPGVQVLFKPAGSSVEFILEAWPEAEWNGGTDRFRRAWLEALQLQEQVRASKQQLNLPDDFKFQTEPYEHQHRAFVLCRDMEYFGLFMDPGTGKTKVAIDNAAYLYHKKQIDTLLVMAPNGVHWNWTHEEVPVHMDRSIPLASYTDAKGHSKKQQRAFERVLGHTGLAVFSFQFGGLASDTTCGQLETVLDTRQCLWVIDESSRIKNPAAKRTQWVVSRRNKAPFRRILTGTPITKGLEDIYSQLLFLNPMILGFNTYTTFKAHYCVERTYEGNMQSRTYIVGYRNTEELIQKVDGCTFRVRKEDCLDLPPKRYQQRTFELSPQARKLYDQMATDYLAEFNGTLVTENFAITRLNRLGQITRGWWPTEDGNELQPIDKENIRLKCLMDVLEEFTNNEKIIIWAHYKPDFRLIENALGDTAVSYHGSVSEAARAQALERFRKDPSCLYLIANPQNAGIGLTLNEAPIQVWYSNTYDVELRLQGEDRIHRIGQKAESVLYIDLLARATIERKIVQALRAKNDVARMVTQDPKSFFLVYEEDQV